MTVEVEKRSSQASTLSVAMVFLLAVAVCLPAILLEYGMHDDYRYFGGQDKGHFWKLHPDMPNGVVMGRPVAMLLIGMQSKLCNEIHDLVVWRFVEFALAAACGILLYRYLAYRTDVPRFYAAALAVAVFTVPSGQLAIIWSVWSIFATPAALLGMLGYLAFDSAYRRYAPSGRWGKYALALIPAWALLLAGLYDYPATAPFFLVPAGAELLFAPAARWNQTRRKILHAAGLMCGSMALFLLSYKLIYLPAILAGSGRLRHAYEALDYHRVRVGYDASLFRQGITSLFEKSLGGPLHPLLLNVATWIGGIFFGAWLVLAGGKTLFRRFTAGGRNGARSPSVVKAVQTGGLFLALVLIPSVPMLVAQGDPKTSPPVVYYRTIFVSCSLVVVLLFRCLMWFADNLFRSRAGAVRHGLAAAFVMISAGAAGVNMTNTALSANRELQFVRREMEKVHRVGGTAFIVRKPGYLPTSESARYPLYGQLRQPFEFDHMATDHTLIWELFAQVGKELGMGVPIDAVEANSDSDLLPSGLPTIDMRRITSAERVRAVRKREPPLPQKISPVKGVAFSSYPVRSRATPTGPWLEIDFPTHQFWEVPRPYPHWIEFVLPPGKCLAGYSMMCSQYPEGPGRMPCRWKVLVGKVDEAMRDVEIRSEAGPWRAHEWKDYSLKAPVEGQRVRLYMEKGLNVGVLRIERFRLKLVPAMPTTTPATS